MSDCVQNTTAFLSKWGIEAASIDMKSLLATFLSEMEKGLENESGSSLKMIPTYTEVVSSLAKGEPVIVLDAGGTNFRTCLVTFDEQGLAHIEDFRKVSMPGVKEEVTAQQFLSTFADEVERLIDKSDKIGFCFSYAAAITRRPRRHPFGILQGDQGHRGLGKKVGASLLSELARRG